MTVPCVPFLQLPPFPPFLLQFKSQSQPGNVSSPVTPNVCRGQRQEGFESSGRASRPAALSAGELDRQIVSRQSAITPGRRCSGNSDRGKNVPPNGPVVRATMADRFDVRVSSVLQDRKRLHCNGNATSVERISNQSLHRIYTAIRWEMPMRAQSPPCHMRSPPPGPLSPSWPMKWPTVTMNLRCNDSDYFCNNIWYEQPERRRDSIRASA